MDITILELPTLNEYRVVEVRKKYAPALTIFRSESEPFINKIFKESVVCEGLKV